MADIKKIKNLVIQKIYDGQGLAQPLDDKEIGRINSEIKDGDIFAIEIGAGVAEVQTKIDRWLSETIIGRREIIFTSGMRQHYLFGRDRSEGGSDRAKQVLPPLTGGAKDRKSGQDLVSLIKLGHIFREMPALMNGLLANVPGNIALTQAILAVVNGWGAAQWQAVNDHITIELADAGSEADARTILATRLLGDAGQANQFVPFFEPSPATFNQIQAEAQAIVRPIRAAEKFDAFLLVLQGLNPACAELVALIQVEAFKNLLLKHWQDPANLAPTEAAVKDFFAQLANAGTNEEAVISIAKFFFNKTPAEVAPAGDSFAKRLELEDEDSQEALVGEAAYQKIYRAAQAQQQLQLVAILADEKVAQAAKENWITPSAQPQSLSALNAALALSEKTEQKVKEALQSSLQLPNGALDTVDLNSANLDVIIKPLINDTASQWLLEIAPGIFGKIFEDVALKTAILAAMYGCDHDMLESAITLMLIGLAKATDEQTVKDALNSAFNFVALGPTVDIKVAEYFAASPPPQALEQIKVEARYNLFIQALQDSGCTELEFLARLRYFKALLIDKWKTPPLLAVFTQAPLDKLNEHLEQFVAKLNTDMADAANPDVALDELAKKLFPPIATAAAIDMAALTANKYANFAAYLEDDKAAIHGEAKYQEFLRSALLAPKLKDVLKQPAFAALLQEHWETHAVPNRRAMLALYNALKGATVGAIVGILEINLFGGAKVLAAQAATLSLGQQLVVDALKKEALSVQRVETILAPFPGLRDAIFADKNLWQPVSNYLKTKPFINDETENELIKERGDEIIIQLAQADGNPAARAVVAMALCDNAVAFDSVTTFLPDAGVQFKIQRGRARYQQLLAAAKEAGYSRLATLLELKGFKQLLMVRLKNTSAPDIHELGEHLAAANAHPGVLNILAAELLGQADYNTVMMLAAGGIDKPMTEVLGFNNPGDQKQYIGEARYCQFLRVVPLQPQLALKQRLKAPAVAELLKDHWATNPAPTDAKVDALVETLGGQPQPQKDAIITALSTCLGLTPAVLSLPDNEKALVLDDKNAVDTKLTDQAQHILKIKAAVAKVSNEILSHKDVTGNSKLHRPLLKQILENRYFQALLRDHNAVWLTEPLPIEQIRTQLAALDAAWFALDPATQSAQFIKALEDSLFPNRDANDEPLSKSNVYIDSKELIQQLGLDDSGTLGTLERLRYEIGSTYRVQMVQAAIKKGCVELPALLDSDDEKSIVKINQAITTIANEAKDTQDIRGRKKQGVPVPAPEKNTPAYWTDTLEILTDANTPKGDPRNSGQHATLYGQLQKLGVTGLTPQVVGRVDGDNARIVLLQVAQEEKSGMLRDFATGKKGPTGPTVEQINIHLGQRNDLSTKVRRKEHFEAAAKVLTNRDTSPKVLAETLRHAVHPTAAPVQWFTQDVAGPAKGLHSINQQQRQYEKITHRGLRELFKQYPPTFTLTEDHVKALNKATSEMKDELKAEIDVYTAWKDVVVALPAVLPLPAQYQTWLTTYLGADGKAEHAKAINELADLGALNAEQKRIADLEPLRAISPTLTDILQRHPTIDLTAADVGVIKTALQEAGVPVKVATPAKVKEFLKTLVKADGNPVFPHATHDVLISDLDAKHIGQECSRTIFELLDEKRSDASVDAIVASVQKNLAEMEGKLGQLPRPTRIRQLLFVYQTVDPAGMKRKCEKPGSNPSQILLTEINRLVTLKKAFEKAIEQLKALEVFAEQLLLEIPGRSEVTSAQWDKLNAKRELVLAQQKQLRADYAGGKDLAEVVKKLAEQIEHYGKMRTAVINKDLVPDEKAQEITIASLTSASPTSVAAMVTFKFELGRRDNSIPDGSVREHTKLAYTYYESDKQLLVKTGEKTDEDRSLLVEALVRKLLTFHDRYPARQFTLHKSSDDRLDHMMSLALKVVFAGKSFVYTDETLTSKEFYEKHTGLLAGGVKILRNDGPRDEAKIEQFKPTRGIRGNDVAIAEQGEMRLLKHRLEIAGVLALEEQTEVKADITAMEQQVIQPPVFTR